MTEYARGFWDGLLIGAAVIFVATVLYALGAEYIETRRRVAVAAGGCGRCGGSGRLFSNGHPAPRWSPVSLGCPSCRGSGKAPEPPPTPWVAH